MASKIVITIDTTTEPFFDDFDKAIHYALQEAYMKIGGEYPEERILHNKEGDVIGTIEAICYDESTGEKISMDNYRGQAYIGSDGCDTCGKRPAKNLVHNPPEPIHRFCDTCYKTQPK